MNLTYKELLDALKDLTPEQLDMTVTVFAGCVDEYYPAQSVKVANGSDILDDNHPYIKI